MRDALALVVFKGKSGRSPTATELLSLCVAKEKVTKEKGHPAFAPDGHPVHQVRGRATGFFDSTSCAGEKLAGIPAGHPAGFPSPTRRCRGAPVEQRAIVARTLHKSQVKSFPLTPTLSPVGGEGAGAVAPCSCCCFAVALLLLLLLLLTLLLPF